MLEQSESLLEPETQSCQDMLLDFYEQYQDQDGKVTLPKGEKLRFFCENAIINKVALHLGVEKEEIVSLQITFYNPTRPITTKDGKQILARVELRDKESSIILSFSDKDNDGEYEIVDDAPVFEMQDPFYCGPLEDKDGRSWQIFGGVKITSWNNEGKATNYQTEFYKFQDNIKELSENQDLSLVASCPQNKDIRLIQLTSGKIGVFTRPQSADINGFGGRGKIAYFEIDNLDQLQAALNDHMANQEMDEIIQGICIDSDWCGANELHLLDDGRIGVLGHIAMMEPDHQGGPPQKSYYAMAFIFDPISKRATKPKIIATMEQFDDVLPKKADLKSVVFSGGLVRNFGGAAWLYLGLGDTEAGRILINDPFID